MKAGFLCSAVGAILARDPREPGENRPVGVGVSDEDDGLASWFDKASLKRWAETQHGSVLGLTQGLSFDEDVAVLRAWLEPVVGEDAELLIAVLVLDESRREVGERLGLATDSGRKRVQRAVARLKKDLAKSLSRFARPDRFSHPQAP